MNFWKTLQIMGMINHENIPNITIRNANFWRSLDIMGMTNHQKIPKNIIEKVILKL